MCISVLVQRYLLSSVTVASTSVKTEYALITVVVQRYIERDCTLE